MWCVRTRVYWALGGGGTFIYERMVLASQLAMWSQDGFYLVVGGKYLQFAIELAHRKLFL